MKIGAFAGLASGAYPRSLTQRWGRALYEDLPNFIGVRYHGAHQNGVCVVVWERTGPLVFDPAEDFSLRSKPMWNRVVVALADQGRAAQCITVSVCPTCQRYGMKNRTEPRRHLSASTIAFLVAGVSTRATPLAA